MFMGTWWWRSVLFLDVYSEISTIWIFGSVRLKGILMSKKSMWSYLKLDSFDIEIPYSQSKDLLISFLREKKISFDTPTEMQVIIKSKMFSLDANFFIAFHFNGEKLIAITIAPDVVLEGSALYCRYNYVQGALENELGRPHNRLRFILDLLDPDSRLSRWQRNGIKVEHYLLNRFGMEEVINIKL